MIDTDRIVKVARGYMDLGMYEDAWSALEEMDTNPGECDEVLEMRFRILQLQERWTPAMQLGELLAGQSPDREIWWLMWAESAKNSGDLELTRNILERALRDHPGQISIIYNLACCESLLGNLDTAKVHLSVAVSLAPEVGDMAVHDSDLTELFASLRQG